MFSHIKNCLISAAACFLVYSACGQAHAEAPLKVVASQAIYADIVKHIGKERVDTKFVASPKFNVHFIQPKPSDVRNVSKADLVVYTGLGLEEWWGPLVEAAGKPDLFPGRHRSVDLSRDIRLLEVLDHPPSRAEGDIHQSGNPHIWMNPENVKIMAHTICEKLKEADPGNTSYYEENERVFIARLDQKISEWKDLCAHVRGKEIISHHADIVYFADFLGMKSEQFLEPKPGIPPTPKHLQFLQEYVKSRNIKTVVMPTYYPKGAADDLTGRIGGTVVMICQNLGEVPGTDDVFGFFDYNFRHISDALPAGRRV